MSRLERRKPRAGSPRLSEVVKQGDADGLGYSLDRAQVQRFHARRLTRHYRLGYRRAAVFAALAAGGGA